MKRTAMIAAAILAVTGINLAPADAGNSGPTTVPSPMQTTVKLTNNVSKNVPSLSVDAEIQGVIANATKYALTPKDMTKLVSLFSDAQQQSITKSSTFSEGYGDKLNAQIESVSKIWKQKYGNDFAISNHHDILSQTFASIQTEAPGSNHEKMESATVAIKGADAATKFHIPLICEKNNDWKINVPDSLTAEKLRANLLLQLSDVDKQAAHGPASESDAYRLVTRHVMAAILDKPMPKHAQASASPQPTAKVAQQTPTSVAKPVAATSSHHWYQFWTKW